jgi:hypothetical protein
MKDRLDRNGQRVDRPTFPRGVPTLPPLASLLLPLPVGAGLETGWQLARVVTLQALGREPSALEIAERLSQDAELRFIADLPPVTPAHILHLRTQPQIPARTPASRPSPDPTPRKPPQAAQTPSQPRHGPATSPP